jgi:Flp pilus assembly protein TadB
MTEVLALGAAYLAGVGPVRLLLLGSILFAPLALVPLVLVVLVHSRKSLDDRAPLFCDGVATELRSGATLRSALLSAAKSVEVDTSSIDAGGLAPIDAVAAAVVDELPSLSPELESVVQASARSGGAVADLFDELSATTIAQNEIAREVRVASAPARATAWFFVLAPTAFIAVRVASGSFHGLLAVPGQRITAVVGMALFGAGLVSVWFLMWRAR